MLTDRCAITLDTFSSLAPMIAHRCTATRDAILSSTAVLTNGRATARYTHIWLTTVLALSSCLGVCRVLGSATIAGLEANALAHFELAHVRACLAANAFGVLFHSDVI